MYDHHFATAIAYARLSNIILKHPFDRHEADEKKSDDPPMISLKAVTNEVIPTPAPAVPMDEEETQITTIPPPQPSANHAQVVRTISLSSISPAPLPPATPMDSTPSSSAFHNDDDDEVKLNFSGEEPDFDDDQKVETPRSPSEAGEEEEEEQQRQPRTPSPPPAPAVKEAAGSRKRKSQDLEEGEEAPAEEEEVAKGQIATSSGMPLITKKPSSEPSQPAKKLKEMDPHDKFVTVLSKELADQCREVVPEFDDNLHSLNQLLQLATETFLSKAWEQYHLDRVDKDDHLFYTMEQLVPLVAKNLTMKKDLKERVFKDFVFAPEVPEWKEDTNTPNRQKQLAYLAIFRAAVKVLLNQNKSAAMKRFFNEDTTTFSKSEKSKLSGYFAYMESFLSGAYTKDIVHANISTRSKKISVGYLAILRWGLIGLSCKSTPNKYLPDPVKNTWRQASRDFKIEYFYLVKGTESLSVPDKELGKKYRDADDNEWNNTSIPSQILCTPEQRSMVEVYIKAIKWLVVRFVAYSYEPVPTTSDASPAKRRK